MIKALTSFNWQNLLYTVIYISKSINILFTGDKTIGCDKWSIFNIYYSVPRLELVYQNSKRQNQYIY